VAPLSRAAGAAVGYLPASRPDLHPSEHRCSKLTEFLRSAAARPVGALVGALGDALRRIRPGDLLGWFGHCGYRYTQS
jgi:hypothetical protein